jgi:hypothetical protein
LVAVTGVPGSTPSDVSVTIPTRSAPVAWVWLAEAAVAPVHTHHVMIATQAIGPQLFRRRE